MRTEVWHLFLFLLPSPSRIVQLVAPRATYLRGESIGKLLRNYKSCADSQKVNRFSFSLSAQPLQLCCLPQAFPSPVTSRLLPPFDSVVVEGNVFFQFSVFRFQFSVWLASAAVRFWGGFVLCCCSGRSACCASAELSSVGYYCYRNYLSLSDDCLWK